MSFRFDGQRTWDPATGWEIGCWSGAYPYTEWRLTHPTEPTIRFWAKPIPETFRDEAGLAISRYRHHVVRIQGHDDAPANAPEPLRALLAAALPAYPMVSREIYGPVTTSFATEAPIKNQ